MLEITQLVGKFGKIKALHKQTLNLVIGFSHSDNFALLILGSDSVRIKSPQSFPQHCWFSEYKD